MIETRHLTRRFDGLVAVSDLDLEVEKGDIYGFIGPNGAGKTTTLKMLATLLEPTSGEAYVCGYAVVGQARFVRRHIGFMPDVFGIYEDMRVDEYLEFFASLYGIEPGARAKIIGSVLEITDLGGKATTHARGLSRGMSQRLGLARILLHDPDVLLLDEPASGLDPRARIEIRGLLKELGAMGKTIIISSHILSELHELCNAIGIIEQGELLYSGPVRDIMEQVREKAVVDVRVEGDPHAAALVLEKDARVSSAEVRGDLIVCELAPGHPPVSFVVDALVDAGHRILLFREEELDLEDAFMRFTEGIVA